MKSFNVAGGMLASTAMALALAACTTAPAPAEETVSVVEEVEVITAEAESPWPETDIDLIDADIEARIDEIMALMTLEQKVGQVIQGDNSATTPEDVKTYHLGSVLSGGNSGPNG